MNRRLSLAIRVAVVGVILAFLVRSVAANWEQVGAFDWRIDPWYGIGAVLCFLGAYAMLPFIWRRVLRALGHDLGSGDAWDIYFMGNLGRYVPGKVWVILGVSYLAGKRGVPSRTAAASAVLAQVYSMLSSVVFFFLFLIFSGTIGDYTGLWWYVPGAVGVIVVALMPGLLERMLNLVLARLGRQPVSVSIRPLTALGITCWYACSWVLMGLGFAAGLAAVAGPGMVPVWQAASIYVVAYAAGFLALFAPGGIGVREGVIGLLLGNTVPMSVAILIAALIRLLATVIELACVGVTILRKGLMHGKEARTK